ncbi:hypothetical protein L798_07843 [Zootermopsis nevadensis]|uniref:Uncharacterized protein n=1 Tax=Zootermopsis nevadensis TaxID=136037 RepID=A0A067R540_ZOONE|nr:hypothetical protein L798_07843 [Zootermopsis nevadensis]
MTALRCSLPWLHAKHRLSTSSYNSLDFICDVRRRILSVSGRPADISRCFVFDLHERSPLRKKLLVRIYDSATYSGLRKFYLFNHKYKCVLEDVTYFLRPGLYSSRLRRKVSSLHESHTLITFDLTFMVTLVSSARLVSFYRAFILSVLGL